MDFGAGRDRSGGLPNVFRLAVKILHVRGKKRILVIGITS